jgi:hypothetical protein
MSNLRRRNKSSTIHTGAVVLLLAAACDPRPSADRVDTITAAPDTLALTRPDAGGGATPAVTGTVGGPPAADTSTPSPVVQSISCTPSTFGVGDTLTLRMGTPHGGELSIHSPDRTVYSLVERQWGTTRRDYSLVPSEDFKRMATLPLAADVRAIALVKGRDTIPEPVFSKPGKYIVVMGENLASDYSNRSSECTVTFVQR